LDDPDLDSRLLVAAREDPEAFGDFWDRNHERVLAYFYRRTFCPHTSAELCAETFAQAWASLKRFDPAAGSGRAWLFGIAGNLFKQWLRRGVVTERARRRLRIETPRLSEDDLLHIESLVDSTDLRAGLRTALDSLSPGVRDAVLMRVGLDLPYEEVAVSLGCTVGAARVRVTRGLHSLAQVLEAGA
jgi:RNA polymerase sigma factor (sigma-70 family)